MTKKVFLQLLNFKTNSYNKEKNTKSIVFVKRSCESNDHNYVKKAPKKC